MNFNGEIRQTIDYAGQIVPMLDYTGDVLLTLNYSGEVDTFVPRIFHALTDQTGAILTDQAGRWLGWWADA